MEQIEKLLMSYKKVPNVRIITIKKPINIFYFSDDSSDDEDIKLDFNITKYIKNKYNGS